MVLIVIAYHLAPAVKTRIITKLRFGRTLAQIATVKHYNIQTIRTNLQNFLRYHSLRTSRLRILGRLKILTKVDEDKLLHFLAQQPVAAHAETVWFLEEEREVSVHWTTVSRILKRKEESFKKASRIAQA